MWGVLIIMSRIGQNPISVPDGVKVSLDGSKVKVSGSNGSLEFNFRKEMDISQNDGLIIVKRTSDNREHRSLHGTTRQMINNMVIGVSKGFSKELEIIGVGYQAQVQGSRLHLQLGFSHDIYFDIPDGIKIVVEKQTTVKISGSNKQQVGMVASQIKSIRPPEPYKGKGIKEKGQYILRKEGMKK